MTATPESLVDPPGAGSPCGESTAVPPAASTAEAVRPAHSPLRRLVYAAIGLFFVALGLLGVLLPLVPTTPFLLLASFFFVRSSPRLNAWLLRSRVFGPFLRDWQKHRGVRPHVKFTALTLLPVAVAGSVTFGDLPWPLIVLLVALAIIGMVVVLRLRVIRDTAEHAA